MLGILYLQFVLWVFQCTVVALQVLFYLFVAFLSNQFKYPLQEDWVPAGVLEDLFTLVRVTHNSLLYHVSYLIHVRQYAIQLPGHQWAQ